MKIITQAKLLVLCLFLISCAQTYNFKSIKENPIYYNSKINGSLTKVMGAMHLGVSF